MVAINDTATLVGGKPHASGAILSVPPLARYKELEEIERGGCGVVIRAYDQQLCCEVALKRILPELAHDAILKRRFFHEARITARLTHPGIAPVHDLGEDPVHGSPFYTMKWLQGQTLAEVIKRYHAMPAGLAKQRSARELLVRFRHVCQTLSYAHQQGVVHRDLKPANILIGQYGETIVLDWGLAKELHCHQSADSNNERLTATTENQLQGADHDEAYNLTRAGSILGTAAYMSPEQAAGQSHLVDQRSDVFSLGVMLYEILGGCSPFRCPTSQETMQHILRSEYRSLRQLDRRIAKPLSAVCDRALMRDPGQRYANAGELERDIQAWLAGEAVTAYPEPWWYTLDRLSSKYRTIFWSTLLCLLFLSIVFIISTVAVSQAHWNEREARRYAESSHARMSQAFQRERIAHQEAITQLQQARGSIDGWLLGLDSVLALYPGLASLRHQLFHQAIDYYTVLAEQTPESALMHLEVVRAKIRLGDIQHVNGQDQEALRNYREALQLLSAVPQWSSGWHAIAKTQEAAALLGISRMEIKLNRLESNRAPIQSAIAICQELVEASEVSEQAYELLASGWHQLALVCRNHHDFDQAQHAIEQSLSVYEARFNPGQWSHSNTQQRQAYLTILNDQASIYIEARDYAAATDSLQRMIHVYDRLLEADAERADWLEGRALARLRAGWCHTQLVQPNESAAQLEASENDLQRAWQLFKGEQSYLEKLSQIHQALGHSYLVSGDLEQASLLFESSLRHLGFAPSSTDANTRIHWLEGQLDLMTIQLRLRKTASQTLPTVERVLTELLPRRGQVAGLERLHAHYYWLVAQIQSRPSQRATTRQLLTEAIQWQLLQSISDQDAAWHYGIGRLYWQRSLLAPSPESSMQDVQAARKHFQAAYQSNDRHWSTQAGFDLMESWVHSSDASHQLPLALNMARDIARDHTLLANAWFWLAELAYWHGEQEQAEQALEKLERLRHHPTPEDRLLKSFILADTPPPADLLATEFVPGCHAAWLQEQLRKRHAFQAW